MVSPRTSITSIFLTVIFVVCGIFDLGHSLTTGASTRHESQKDVHTSLKKNHLPDEDIYHHSKLESVFKKASCKNLTPPTDHFSSFHYLSLHLPSSFPKRTTKNALGRRQNAFIQNRQLLI
jgi:hypothetical protein